MKFAHAIAAFCAAAAFTSLARAEGLKLNDKGYFAKPGLT